MHDVVAHSAVSALLHGITPMIYPVGQKVGIGKRIGDRKGAEMFQYRHLDCVLSVAVDDE